MSHSYPATTQDRHKRKVPSSRPVYLPQIPLRQMLYRCLLRCIGATIVANCNAFNHHSFPVHVTKRIRFGSTATASPAKEVFTGATLKSELLQIRKLSHDLHPTTFAASDWLQKERACSLSSIRVSGIDRDIPIPISKEDMVLLREKAERAPFGFGSQTLLNQTVRDAWQVDGRNVWSESQPSFFQRTVQTMVLQALESQLGLDTSAMDVHATLYKMLLYEEGGHFLPHRDAEKEPGMFGTYLLQIPVEGGHEGGQLCIRHQGEKLTIDTSTQSTSAAFQEAVLYADCKHELKKVTRGRRCVLAFNLSWRAKVGHNEVSKKRELPMSIIAGLPSSQAVALSKLVERTHKLIDGWAEPSTGLKWISIPLDHKYTEENLSFDRLKGKDKLLAQPFLAVPATKLAMYLVLEAFKYTEDADQRFRLDYQLDGEVRNPRENLKKMNDFYLEMVSRENKKVYRRRVRHCLKKTSGETAFELHKLLNRIGSGPVLHTSKIDELQPFCERTGNSAQSEERTYFRSVLLLAPKHLGPEMLSTLGCEYFGY